MSDRIYEIGKEFYLLRSDEPDFHRNIYFKIFKSDRKNVNMIMDPGSRLDIESLQKALEKLIGGIEEIDIIFLSHQDPDVSSSLPFLLAVAPRAILITSKDTIRLVKMYGIPSQKIKAVEDFKSETVIIKDTGHKVRFIPAYFCHFRGAMMFYDLESRVLFTGDFMGGLNTIDGNPLYANEKAWDGIFLFHSIYMPSNIALRETVDRIGLLNPFPEVIAPQHGYVVRSDLIVEFLNRLSELNVGIDLLTSEEPTHEQFLLAINDFRERIKRDHPLIFSKLSERMKTPGNFTTPFVIKGDQLVKIEIPPSDALRFLLSIFEEELEYGELSKLKTLLAMSLEKFNISHLLEILKAEENKQKQIDFKSILSEL
ncbi:MAG: MBL fold metallo-hydrolase [Candidatus Aminicenantia bacterium]